MAICEKFRVPFSSELQGISLYMKIKRIDETQAYKFRWREIQINKWSKLYKKMEWINL